MPVPVIAFTKVAYPYGWLGNMSPHPLQKDGVTYRTSEHLFQCMRFSSDPKIQEDIRSCLSPMGAKMRAKKYRSSLVGKMCGIADLRRMEECLRLKCKQHPQVLQSLLKTGNAQLIEDCTGRPHDIEVDGRNHAKGQPFWGARWDKTSRLWVGQNALGAIWMKLRAYFTKTHRVKFRSPASFIGHLYVPMNSKLLQASQETRERAAQLAKLAKVESKVLSLLKSAGFTSITDFTAAIDAATGGAPQPAPKKRGPKPTGVAKSAKKSSKSAGGKSGIVRTRITAAKVAKMKVLNGKGLSDNKIATKLNVSVPSVGRYRKNDFKFTEKK